MSSTRPYLIDGLQYSEGSREVFSQMRASGLDAVHTTICYHETLRETIANIQQWNLLFASCSDLIMHGLTAADIDKARQSKRVAVFFGLQNCSTIEDDIGLLEICHKLGVRFMQLSYNNQSLLASGCYEKNDAGITRMGEQAIKEMNRLGMVVDMSHSGEESTMQAIAISQRPIAITHANPAFWHSAPRSKSERVLKAIADSEGMLGFSLYPYHLQKQSECTLENFCQMVARTAEVLGGVNSLGIGSDLCQGQPNAKLNWMREGRWMLARDDKPAAELKFPQQPRWFRDNRDFHNIARGLLEVGFAQNEVDKIMGGNWFAFFDRSLAPSSSSSTDRAHF